MSKKRRQAIAKNGFFNVRWKEFFGFVRIEKLKNYPGFRKYMDEHYQRTWLSGKPVGGT